MSKFNRLNGNLKFITEYSDYIAEQEFDEEGMPIPEPEENRFRYIFVIKGQEGKKKYPDGSSSSIFKTYEIKEKALKSWLVDNVKRIDNSDFTDNEAMIKRKKIYDYITGKKGSVEQEDIKFLQMFRTATITEMIAKEVDKTEVFFEYKTKVPTTDKIDVTFITLNSK